MKDPQISYFLYDHTFLSEGPNRRRGSGRLGSRRANIRRVALGSNRNRTPRRQSNRVLVESDSDSDDDTLPDIGTLMTELNNGVPIPSLV